MGNKRKGFNAGAAGKCLLIGLVSSTVLIGLYIFLELAWLRRITYNESLRSLFLGQIALLAILVPLLTGMIAAWSVSSLKIRFNGYALAGLISGITGGLGFYVTVAVLMMTWNIVKNNLLDWAAIHGMVYPALTSGLPDLFSDVVYLAPLVLLSMMLSAIGGGIFFVISYYSGKGKKGKSKKPAKNLIPYIAAILLAVIILPIAAAYAGTASGVIKSDSFVYPVDVQRTSDDSILFTNNGIDNLTYLNTSQPFIVYLAVGGGYVKDMSDQQAALKDKLNVTLTPASGLGMVKGSTLAVTGPDLASLAYKDNTTGKMMDHVMVIGTTVDGNEVILRETSV